MSTPNATMIVLPGGAYLRHAPHEGEPVAEWLESLGWQTRVLHYPVAETHPTPLHPAPLASVQAEILAARAAGAELVGVLGFSAGGHLAGHSALAPDAHAGTRPDLAVLAYPVVSMGPAAHPGSRTHLLGDDADEEQLRLASLENLVTPEAPPFFIWHTADDASVPVEHAYLLASALGRAGVPHELHVFEEGTHGLGLAPGHPAAVWTELATAWLTRQRER